MESGDFRELNYDHTAVINETYLFKDILMILKRRGAKYLDSNLFSEGS